MPRTATTVLLSLLLLLSFLILPTTSTTTTTTTDADASPTITRINHNDNDDLFIIHLPNRDISPDLNSTYYNPGPCDTGMGDIHISSHVDKAGNRIDIYCMWNTFLGYETPDNRQYIGFYNDITIIGQCPFVHAWNTWTIQTDEQGIINATSWTSVSADNPKKSVTYSLTFNQYNASYSPAVAPGAAPAALFWELT